MQLPIPWCTNFGALALEFFRICADAANSPNDDLANTLPAILPLPEGEGRGEGELESQRNCFG
jgi:hypothetical protein